MKDNKLIAEFMGHKLGLDGDGMGEPQSRIFESGLGTKRIEDTYNTSWDWLMPVIRKVLTSIDIDSLNYDTDELKFNVLDCDIEGAHKEVVEFIKECNDER
jgi:hypothetical protein